MEIIFKIHCLKKISSKYILKQFYQKESALTLKKERII